MKLLLERYAQVLHTAWAQRHELDGPARTRQEAAFLPARMALQETPPHPLPRRIIVALCAFFTIALVWAALGKLDIVASAQGRIVVSNRSKLIQPLDPGVIRAVHVREGEHVKAGQLLLELDDTDSKADHQNIALQIEAARGEQQRTSALLHALNTWTQPPANGMAQEQARLLLLEWKDLLGKRQQLHALQATRQAEWNTAKAAKTKLETTLPWYRKRETDYQALAKDGFVHQHATQDLTRQRLEAELELERLQAETSQRITALQEARDAMAAWEAETRRLLADRHRQATDQLARLGQEQEKTMNRDGRTRLSAPVDGVVQQLEVHHPGAVVTPAQVLMVIVPHTEEVSAEILIANKDIGFIRPGQQARIKLDAFPFTRYGTVDAVVTHTSANAITPAEQSGQHPDTLASLAQQAVFPARLKLQQSQIEVDGRKVQITPGLMLTAEIKTGQRTVLDYLLSPILKDLNESGNER